MVDRSSSNAQDQGPLGPCDDSESVLMRCVNGTFSWRIGSASSNLANGGKSDRNFTNCVSKLKLLIESMTLCNFSQYNGVTNNYNSGILDLVLSTFEVSVTDESNNALVNVESFHLPLLIDLKRFHQREKINTYTYKDYTNAIYDNINARIREIE